MVASRAEIRALLRKYDRPGPRYTSYPTAPQFHGGIGAEDYAERLQRLGAADDVSLYVHVPFCVRRCTYCGCFVIPTSDRPIAEAYVQHVGREVRSVRSRMPAAPRVVSLHLGGGTPTYLRPEELAALCREVEGAFPLAGAREVSVEIDPRVTTAEHLEVLRAAGASRVSLGVQDASEEVQSAIGRHQTWEETAGCHALCRRLGFESVNIDLVYGLPLQSTARFAHTLDAVLGLRPDRFAVFGYAHVPWIRSNQKAIDPAALPGADERLDLFLMAHEKLTAAGYVHVGLDHFALEGDPLAGAQAEGSLGRNFMGYTPFRGSQVLGFGVSSIGDVGAGYFQNEKKLSRYFARLERGELPVERGWVSSPDDRLRRFVIEEILSNQRLDGADFERRSGLPFAAYFDVEGKRLEELEDDGLIERRDGVLHVTSIGRLFLRNIAMVFDAYLESRPAGSPGRPLYSRTV